MKDPAPAAREARVFTTGTHPAAGTPDDDLFHRDALALAEQSA